MGKRNKNIEVEINETKNNTETYTEYELLVRKKLSEHFSKKVMA